MKNTTAFILILVSAGLFYTVISPQYKKVQIRRAEALEYKNIISNLSELTAKRDELLIKYQALPKSEVDRLSKVLPDGVDTVKLAKDLDTIASKYGISIKNIQVNPIKDDNGSSISQGQPNKPYESTTVSLTFVSTYDSFRKFMADMEHSLRIIDIKSVSFTSGESGINEYKVDIQTYWLK